MARGVTMHLLLALSLALSAPSFGAAQSHPLVGEWKIRVPTQVRGENGAPTPMTLNGTLTVAQQADSLVATITMDPVPGQPASPLRRMAAVRRSGVVRFASTTTATLRGGSDEMQREATTTYVLDVKDNQLVGSIELEIPGVPDIPPRAIAGTRATP
ncbi:MAG: hypothetical protein IT353_24260 [Gemmatimonadaceae bacterium]|nr:hypothetical protein [Gemmatimonadaceae bacterium]